MPSRGHPSLSPVAAWYARRVTSIRPCLLLILCPLAVAVPGSQPSSGSQQSHDLKVATRLVQVTVVAQDSKGRAIPDLTRDDFEAADQGKPQEISVSTTESNRNVVGRAAPLPKNVHSNLPARSGASQNFTAILFDLLNTPVNDQATVRKEITRFLHQLQPQDRVAIYGLSSTLGIRDSCERIRIVLRDTTSGAIGTVTVPARGIP